MDALLGGFRELLKTSAPTSSYLFPFLFDSTDRDIPLLLNSTGPGRGSFSLRRLYHNSTRGNDDMSCLLGAASISSSARTSPRSLATVPPCKAASELKLPSLPLGLLGSKKKLGLA